MKDLERFVEVSVELPVQDLNGHALGHRVSFLSREMTLVQGKLGDLKHEFHYGTADIQTWLHVHNPEGWRWFGYVPGDTLIEVFRD